MANLLKKQLLEAILRAIDLSGWSVLYDAAMQTHPFKIRIHRGDQFRRLKIYIWNVSHGGGYRRPTDEYRIQVKVPYFEPEQGWQVLILGWWDEGQVFAGFDYRKHSGEIGFSSSFQIKLDALEKAAINGFAPSDKGNKEIAVAFRPDLLVEYANHVNDFHSLGESRRDLEILELIASSQEDLQNNEIVQQVSRRRLTAFQTVRRALRDHSFKTRVLTAYDHRCAFCDVQLNLIDAAHIVPVSHEQSTDETRNGIALCTLHHKAYDAALVTFNERYQIVSSNAKIEQLRQIRRDGGWTKFSSDLRPVINVPPENRDRPLVLYVNEANRIRGWVP